MARKFITQKKQTKEEMFNSLVKNAIDFVDSSLDDLGKRPKNSIVDFYTSIELFLKARLMKEHWTLILTKPESADIDSFQVGDFNSVFLSDSVKRLEHIMKEKIDDQTISKFRSLGEHRNQIVHFAHTGYSDLSKASVVVEQWESWHYLHQLLTVKWKDIFNPYSTEIERIHARIMKEKEFLDARFKALKGSIDIEIKKGRKIVFCNHCEKKAGVGSKENTWGTDYTCLVCGRDGVAIKSTTDTLPCYSCGQEYEFFNKFIKNCPHCAAPVETEKFIDECAKRYTEGDDWWEEGAPHIAFCHECDYPKASVFYIDGLWSCVSCFDRGWKAISCPSCNKFVTGDIERIQYWACHKCEEAVQAV